MARSMMGALLASLALAGCATTQSTVSGVPADVVINALKDRLKQVHPLVIAYQVSMKTVFVLGAGASLACGAPLMRDFIPVAKKPQDRNLFGASHAQIQDVLNAAYKDLRSVQAKAASST